MPTRHPSLGLSDKGLLLAAWATDDGLLTTEFLPNDGIRWSLSVSIDGEVDRAVGTTSVARFLSCLSPYHPKKWFHEEAAKKR